MHGSAAHEVCCALIDTEGVDVDDVAFELRPKRSAACQSQHATQYPYAQVLGLCLDLYSALGEHRQGIPLSEYFDASQRGGWSKEEAEEVLDLLCEMELAAVRAVPGHGDVIFDC